LVNNNDATIGEIRFKHADPGTVFFKKLVMNGGQLDNGDNGLLILTGQMDIRSNAPIYVDSAANQDRSYRIDSWLTGTGNIEWDQFGPALTTNSLNITGTSNTYSGTWHVVQGALLGSGQGSLGPGNITVDAFGALETLYDINNPNGNLILDPSAQVFLHQNDRFATVTIGGTPLSVGTHSFAELSANYSANFPSAWTSIRGSTFSTGSGSITVLGAAPPPVTINFSVSGGNLTLTWSQGTLLEATNVSGPWVTNGAASPYTVAPTGPQRFFRVQTQ
jgi:hypothetical protein